MALEALELARPSSHWELNAVEELDALKRPSIRSARWRRSVPEAALASWLHSMESSERTARGHAGLAPALAQVLPEADHGPAAAWLRQDIAALTTLFMRLRPTPSWRLKLEKVTRPACRRFHHDFVWLRLICTYAGSGTLLVAHEDANLSALDVCEGEMQVQNDRIVPDPRRIRASTAGDVLLLKGARHPDTAGVGAIHRSPEASPDTPRLVLTIDAEPGR